MFTIHDIDNQIAILKNAATDLESKAPGPVRYEGIACGLREAAYSLERMIERAVEAEAREAMRS